MTLTAYVITLLLFIAKGEPVVVSQVYPDRFSCEKVEAALADKAMTDATVVGWVLVGKPCEPIKESNKI